MIPTSRPSRIRDSRGRLIHLGGLLGSGGEGAVYEVADRPSTVAKIYSTPEQDRLEKLRAMAQVRSERLSKIAAWPIDTIHNSQSGEPVGFLMPRIEGYQDIHLLYGPRSRLDKFPNAGWPFLIHAAANVARAFRLVHELGLVIGDVNHGNILVSDRATIRLIDCDSFQVTVGGRTFPCKVGVGDFTPPELQGQSFGHGVVRTPNHDAFGLAIILFLLLFMGRHPYSGTSLDKVELPIGRAIRENRFVYGTGAARIRMQAPPFALALSSVSVRVAALFEAAFSGLQGVARQRPSAAEWVAALEDLERSLKTCSSDPSHQYVGHLSNCPWCRIESDARLKGIRIHLFNPLVLLAGAKTKFDLVAVWAEIETISSPSPLPAVPSPFALKPQPSAEAVREGQERRRRRRIVKTLGAVSALFFVLFLLSAASGATGWLFILAVVSAGAAAVVRRSTPARVRKDAAAHLVDARSEFDKIRRQLEAEAGEQNFLAKKEDLRRRREEYVGLDNRRQQMIQQLANQAERLQRQRFLERHRIWQAGISGIGPERSAMLQSYGIETAADVTANAVAGVPGFGPVLTSSLLAWRQGIERRFRFDPLLGIDPKEILVIDRHIQSERSRLENELSDGAVQLRLIAQQALAQRTRLMAPLEAALARRVQAEADLSVLV